jgi:hypothetical protein
VEEIKHRASLNLGGNSEIYVTRYTNVVKIPRVVDGAIVGDLIVSAIWHPIEFLAYSLDYDESTDDDRSGDKVKVTIDFIIAQETKEVKRLLRLLRQERLAVIIKDLSLNQYRLIGGKHEFLSHSKDFKTGSNPANRNQNAVRLQGLVKDTYLYEGYVQRRLIPPSNFQLIPISSTQINISWSNHNNSQASTEVWVKIGAGAYALLATIATGISIYEHTGLSSEMSYTYKIRAKQGDILSVYSAERAITINDYGIGLWQIGNDFEIQ